MGSDIDRRSALMLALAAAGMTAGHEAMAQTPPFDPVAIAKLRAGEVAREIKNSSRNSAIPAPSEDAVFEAGLLLQAGLRALLPVAERNGVALPGAPSSADSAELVEAQENYRVVFESGSVATPAQHAVALKSIGLAVDALEKAGYSDFAKAVSDWLKTQHTP